MFYIAISRGSFMRKNKSIKEPKIHEFDGLFKKMVETVPEGIILIHAKTLNVEFINESLSRLLNISGDAFIGREIPHLDLFCEIDFFKKIIDELKSKPLIRYEDCLLNSGKNQKIYVGVIGHVFEFNNVRYIKLHIRDETKRREIEENLRRSELSLNEAQHQARIGSWTWDPKTDDPVWSEEMFHIFGMDSKLPPANFTEAPTLYAPKSWELLKNAVENTLLSGESYELDTEVIKKDGTHIWATCRGNAVWDSNGNILGLRGSVQDINDRKITEKLEAETEILKRADRMKSMFLANMSHELRSPLNSIIGFSEMLKDGLLGDLTERQRKYIGNMYNSGEHLLSLINDILDLSKVESGTMTLDMEPIDISTLLSNGLDMVGEKALKHRITLISDIDKNIGAFLADARKVKQIVYNLLFNAIKFTNDGGKITLIARLKQSNDVGNLSGIIPGRNFKLPENEFKEFVEISVVDNGIGIPTPALDQLFQPFSQVDSGLSRKFEGTGLGLALVKQMTELHGGTVMVESSPGQGSIFSVWLPLRYPVEKPTPAAEYMILPNVKKGEQEKQTVLVVEDDDQAAELIRIQLESENLRAFHVKSAEAALELVKEVTPDLITLDILLPGMDGWEFLGRIKQIPALSKTPVVIISMVASETKGISLGASAVLQKPIGRDELHKTLSSIGFHEKLREYPYRILVVDDDPDSVEILAGHLNIFGFLVVRAYGGREAIHEAHRIKPDLIVLDLMMPEVSGFDVVEDIKGHTDTINIPIIMVTSRLITNDERGRLKVYGINIHGKSEINHDSFMHEVRRVLSINNIKGIK
jgi:PAS domain S-box-containing protein